MAAKEKREREREAVLLEELKAAVEKLGVQIREERLLREVGYRVRSGSCRVRDGQYLFLERDLPISAQIDVLVDELANRSLEDIYLSPAARTLVERAAMKGAPPDGGSEAIGG
jgi:hypothetical protein